MTVSDSASPLRQHGIYRFRGRTYVATHLSTDDRPWRATALVSHPFDLTTLDLVYLRHADGALLSVVDFAPIGTLADLVDTGGDAEEDG